MALAVWRVSGFRNAKSSAVMDWRRHSLPTTVGTGIPRRCSPEYSVKMKELGMRSWLNPSTRSKKRSRQLLRRAGLARCWRKPGSARKVHSRAPSRVSHGINRRSRIERLVNNTRDRIIAAIGNGSRGRGTA